MCVRVIFWAPSKLRGTARCTSSDNFHGDLLSRRVLGWTPLCCPRCTRLATLCLDSSPKGPSTKIWGSSGFFICIFMYVCLCICRSQKPLKVWFLTPETLDIGYLNPPGKSLCSQVRLEDYIPTASVEDAQTSLQIQHYHGPRGYQHIRAMYTYIHTYVRTYVRTYLRT